MLRLTQYPIKSLLAVNAIALLVTTAAVASNRVRSSSAISKRSQGLEVLSQHVLARTCWSSDANLPYKIGDRIYPEGSEDGRIPTSCIYVPKAGQFLQVSYLGGELRVQNAYSRQELRNQISVTKRKK